MKNSLKSFAVIACMSSFTALANPLLKIYPHTPFSLEEVNERVSRVTEEAAPLMNIFEMDRMGLKTASTHTQSWGGYFWALNQGQIANNWQDKNYLQFWEMLRWKGNVNTFKKRRVKHLPNVMEMEEKDLAKLAPSEKYDLLLGDLSFDLTHRIWNHTETWGNQKKWGYLSSIDLPNGYRVPKANKLMALWEGICHGWALAAGAYPRPEKTVSFTLPNGKQLPFYPDDIKALVSLLFANSVVQDNVIVEGLRCNDKRPSQDEFGRFVDNMPKKEGEPVLPSCADVHPGVWHASIVNLLGIQGRSFVVDVDANATVNNHPMNSYTHEWFNPSTGESGDLASSVISLEGYDDPYKNNRSPFAKRLVGVEMEIEYLAWTLPKDRETDGLENDEMDKKKFMYDLELDEQGNIVGGQWRATKTARRFGVKAVAPKIAQPDFFWVTPKNYMTYFQSLPLEKWDGKGQVPASWKDASNSAHSFVYNVTREFGFDERCTVIPSRGRGTKEVPCEFKYPRPQPLINVVNQILEMSLNK